MYRTALRMLLGDPVKCIGLVMGVALSTLLLCQQLSIFFGLLERAASVIKDARQCDVWVMDPSVTTIDVSFPLRDTALSRVRGVSGVSWAAPFFRANAQVRTREGTLENALLLGVDDVSLVGVPDRFGMGSIESLAMPESIAVNPAGFRLLFPGEPLSVGRELEINDRRAVISAIVEASPSFSANLILYTRYSLALQYTNNGRNQLSFILVKPSAGLDASGVAERIANETGLKAITSEVFRRETIGYILANTGIPASFGTVVFLGALIGIAIVGLTFNQFIMENLKQYAALKAIGVGNGRLLTMTMFQALFVGTIGYGLGLGAAGFFFATATKADGLAGFYLLPGIAIGVAVVTVFMVFLATLVSMRRVLSVDPATVFRG